MTKLKKNQNRFIGSDLPPTSQTIFFRYIKYRLYISLNLSFLSIMHAFVLSQTNGFIWIWTYNYFWKTNYFLSIEYFITFIIICRNCNILSMHAFDKTYFLSQTNWDICDNLYINTSSKIFEPLFTKTMQIEEYEIWHIKNLFKRGKQRAKKTWSNFDHWVTTNLNK